MPGGNDVVIAQVVTITGNQSRPIEVDKIAEKTRQHIMPRLFTQAGFGISINVTSRSVFSVNHSLKARIPPRSVAW